MKEDKKLVAVFDDDQDLLTIFQFLFEDAGYRVKVFNNCNDIVNKVGGINPDLILMDNWIPGTGGEVAVQALKANNDLRKIPVIYISANNDIEEIATRAGADRFMPKPFEFDDLLGMANELVNKQIS